MRFDMYDLKARVFPALVTIVVPILVFNQFYVNAELAKFVGFVFGLSLLTNISMAVVCLYFLSEIWRLIAKNVFERIYFKEEAHMPTTNFLMYADPTYSAQYKSNVRIRVHSEFSISLPDAD